MNKKQLISTALISALTAMVVVMGYAYLTKNDGYYGGQPSGPSNYKLTGLDDGNTPPGVVDLTTPAQIGLPAVVHIKTKTNAKQVTNNLPRMRQQSPFSDFFGDDLFDQFFGGGRINVIPEQRASGSGVIISDDGFIVTNNHVIEKADEITVTLNDKKTYKATLVGSDPSYDLAVIKIDAKRLPYLLYGNSDDVRIGQWVLAIGYPLNLETTVTAGIVSAKARSLGLNKDRNGSGATAVESFIQTDAAVNSGNSGGALINSDGKLIGINSAIASPTGYYSGYSYAIPVNIAKKVVDDLIRYGTVQRGYLGIQFSNAADMTVEQKNANDIPEEAYDGVYVIEVPKDGAAAAAGIRKGDKLLKINSTPITNGSELQEQISRFKPGDKISVTVLRDKKEQIINVTLRNKAGTIDLVKGNTKMDLLGADFATLESAKAKDYNINGGVVVKKIKEGALNDQTRMKDGFVILKINDTDVKNVEEMRKAIGNQKDINISGFYPGYDGVYEYPITLENE